MDTPHTGTMGEYKTAKIPHAAITSEDAMMISRISKEEKSSVKVKYGSKICRR